MHPGGIAAGVLGFVGVDGGGVAEVCAGSSGYARPGERDGARVCGQSERDSGLRGGRGWLERVAVSLGCRDSQEPGDVQDEPVRRGGEVRVERERGVRCAGLGEREGDGAELRWHLGDGDGFARTDPGGRNQRLSARA